MDNTKYLPNTIFFSYQCSTKQNNYFHAFLFLKNKKVANGDTFSATIRIIVSNSVCNSISSFTFFKIKDQISFNSDIILIDMMQTVHGNMSVKSERRIKIGLYFIIRWKD